MSLDLAPAIGSRAPQGAPDDVLASVRASVGLPAGARVVGVVGRDGGYTKTVADACVIIPTVNSETITPHTEAFHAVVWHLIVTHPDLKKNAMKWESTR